MKKTLLLCVLLCVGGVAVRAQGPAETTTAFFTLKDLGNGNFAAIDDAKGDAGANAGFVIGQTGVAVIDTFENPKAAQALLDEIRKRTKIPVRFVVNTHYHLDHVAGNKVFHDAGAVIIAQDNVMRWIHIENMKFFPNATPEQKAIVDNLVGPDIGYSRSATISLGDRELRLQTFPGHTGGDTVVDAGSVIYCGDLFWRKTLPNLIDATTSAWTNSLVKIQGLEQTAVFVPGHGDVGNLQDMQDFRNYLLALRDWVKAALASGKTGDELANLVLPNLKAKYGSWDLFDYFAKKNVLDMANELNGTKVVPHAPISRDSN